MAKLILTPYTKISTYDNLSRNANTTILGNIGYTISDEKKIRDEFYKSKIGRKNIEILSELISELYTFINRNLAKYSDPESYWFRAYFTIVIDDANGEILSKPIFDVDLYKHVGKISGRSSSEKSSEVDIILADLAKAKLAKYFNSGIRLVKENVPLINYNSFNKYHEVPSEYRDLINEEHSYIIINKKIHQIKYDIKDNIINYFIDRENKIIYLNNQMDIFNFILSEIKMEPEIISHSTVFKYSDTEIKNMEKEVKSKYSIEVEEDYQRDSDTILLIEKMYNDIIPLREKLINRKKIKKDYKEELKELEKRCKTTLSTYEEHRINFYSHKELLKDMTKKLEGGAITNDEYSTHKLKSLNNINKSIIEINKINNIFITDIIPNYNELFKKVYKRSVEK